MIFRKQKRKITVKVFKYDPAAAAIVYCIMEKSNYAILAHSVSVLRQFKVYTQIMSHLLCN